jgi:hypothetical protein
MLLMNLVYQEVKRVSYVSWHSSQIHDTHKLIIASSRRIILPLIVSALFSLLRI